MTLQHHFAGATGAQQQALGVTGESLVAMRQWTFLLGPGVMAGVNDLFLGYILYRSGLVGRVIPIIGLVGGPLILLSDTMTILGVLGPDLRASVSCSASPSPCSSSPSAST